MLQFFVAKCGIFIVKCNNDYALILSEDIAVITKINLYYKICWCSRSNKINQRLALANEIYRSFYEYFEIKLVCPDI